MDAEFGLVADIGGTYVRFAVAGLGRPLEDTARRLAVRDYPTAVGAAQSYLAGMGVKRAPMAAVFAVAGPVVNDAIDLTNAGWRISAASLRDELGVRTAHLINDFEAIALAVPHLQPADFHAIGPIEKPPLDLAERDCIAIVGPGTGLGIGGLIRVGSADVPIVTEGGHVAFAPGDDVEIEILRILMRGREHVSAERVLSGPGLANLYRALAEIEGAAQASLMPEEITERARAEPDSLAGHAFARFCAILGSVAGDVALTLGARKGVLIAGGIVPDMADMFPVDAFRGRFEAKGRFRDYMQAIPTHIIMHTNPALIGAASLLPFK